MYLRKENDLLIMIITLNLILIQEFKVQPESSKSAVRQEESENPMEDRSSFPGPGSGKADGLSGVR